MNIRPLLFTAVCWSIFFSGCVQTDRHAGGREFGKTFQLAFDTSVQMEGGTEISFIQLLKDSRCPDDALCTWEGEAVIAIAVQHDRESPNVVEMKIPGYVDRYSTEGHSTFILPEFTITLLQLDPYPVIDHSQPKIAYVATLLIEKN
jgi:hypothetical protein